MSQFPCADQSWQLLLRSCRLRPLFESWIEEQICSCVPLDSSLEAELVSSFNPPAFLTDPIDLRYAASRLKRLEMFKRTRFSLQVEEYFSRTRSKREQVIFSMIRSSNLSRIQELSLAIREGEIDFAAAAIRWSEGPESARGGRIGPLPVCDVGHQDLSQRLMVANEGHLISPFPIGDTYVLLRLDKRLAARLDEPLQVQLIEELYQDWLNRQIALVEEGGTIEPIEYLPG